MTIHPARQYGYWEVVDGLAAQVAAGYINRTPGENGLAIYTYSKSCVYERAWNPFTLMARGLIVDHDREDIVATPWPKFFNLGENDASLFVAYPDLPFEVFEKVDGSLIILFNHDGRWHTATKGSFKSDQAIAAAEYLKDYDLGILHRGSTYLFEWVAPNNRIVVHYDKPELVLLGAYQIDGVELPYSVIRPIAEWIGWRVANRYSFDSIADLVAHTETLPSTAEGFVLRFSDGTRLKVKGEEYKRIHRLISRCTPLAMWDAMRAGDDLDLLRRELPEEFWPDFDCIISLLKIQLHSLIAEATEEAHITQHLLNKEIGLMTGLKHKSFVFSLRNSVGGLLGNPRSREQLFRAIRPTGNKLEGYTPSRSINLIMEEAA